MSWIITQRRGFNRQSGSCVFKVCTSFWSRFTHNHTTTTHNPDTSTHTQSTRQDLPVFVLLEEEERAEIRSLWSSCLSTSLSQKTWQQSYSSNRQMAAGKVRKSLHPSPHPPTDPFIFQSSTAFSAQWIVGGGSYSSPYIDDNMW